MVWGQQTHPPITPSVPPPPIVKDGMINYVSNHYSLTSG